jgi:class 3 adenylate cyclase
MARELSIEDLARWTEEPVERLREWRSLGLVGTKGDGKFEPADLERARMVQLLLRRGIGLEMIAQAEEEQGFLRRYLETVFPEGVRPAYPLAEAAEMIGMDPDQLRRFSAASGFADQVETLTEADVEGMAMAKTAMDAGFPEEALLQMVRVYADSLARVGEAESRLWRFYVHERRKTEGLSGQQLMEATQAASDRGSPLMEPVVLYFHRKGWERGVREDFAMGLAEEVGLTEMGEVPGQLQRAIAFVDLSSFTPLAEAMGDEKAAEVLERFSRLVRVAAGRWDGRVVKQIGDAFMLVFPDARSGVACALEIEARTEEEPHFPAVGSGVHFGSVLYREGDYVGSNVNIASRVATEAERHQVLVTAPVRQAAKDLTEVEFARLGKRRLKGLTGELVLFEARPAGVESRETAVDPVCGMALRPAEVAARLSLEGQERAFCSDECLRQFVASPEKYPG